jgi:hypothetical protein
MVPGMVVERRKQFVAVWHPDRLGLRLAGVQELFDKVTEDVRLDQRGD